VNETPLNVADLVKQALQDAVAKLGRVNILIAGRTGVGKSTLINAVFQGNLATTGQGRPVTRHTREITKEGVPLSIFDTRGLEMGKFVETNRELQKLVAERRADRDPDKHIHACWLCIAEDSRRVEEAESQLCVMLAEYAPVVAVITKARADQGFRGTVKDLLPSARNVVRVLAQREELDDGHAVPPMGLQDLVALTLEVIPEGARRALTAAQKVDLGLKRQRARAIVGASAASAVALVAIPVPVADAALLVPVQVSMIAAITAAYGLTPSGGFVSGLIASTVTGAGATLTGRAIVAGLFKLLPGPGTVVGGAVSAATAASVTTAFGEAYIAVLERLFARHLGEPPSTEEILSEFKRELTIGARSAAPRRRWYQFWNWIPFRRRKIVDG
jgi:uncharacterized protein (DUF697 family)/GTP-binding protein EngB required for normal cell division